MKMTVKAALVAATMFATPAMAGDGLIPLFQSGPWDVMGGHSDDGKRMCVMTESAGDTVFALKWFYGDGDLTVHLADNDWRSADGLNVPVEVTFDGQDPWYVTATAHERKFGTILQFYVKGDDSMRDFIIAMKDAQTMQVAFPGNDVPSVTIDLTGSSKSLVALGECIDATSDIAKHEDALGSQYTLPDQSRGEPLDQNGRTPDGDFEL